MPASVFPVLEHAYERVRERADSYYCFLADQPEYLVPERLFALESNDEHGRRWIVSPNVWFSWNEPCPSSFCDIPALPDAFLASPGIVWVICPETGIRWPFWTGPWFREKLSRLTKGAPPAGLSRHQERVLAAAGILIDPGASPKQSAKPQEPINYAVEGFQQQGFATLPALMHPFQLGALRRYYRRLLRLGGMELGDNSSAFRYVAYNESVASFFHQQFARIVSSITGVRVQPSFSYVVSYQGGASLPLHTDRAQCEFAVSLLIDYVPEPSEQSPWPLKFATESGWRNVWQCLGDAVLYGGTALPHARDALGKSATSTSMLFYYVSENFTGALA
jgi:hypothetical protein